MKSEERPAVVLLALPIRRPLRREPPVIATLHTCARPVAVLGISLRDYRGLSPYLLTGSRWPKSGDELPTHMPEESGIAVICRILPWCSSEDLKIWIGEHKEHWKILWEKNRNAFLLWEMQKSLSMTGILSWTALLAWLQNQGWFLYAVRWHWDLVGALICCKMMSH